jgi:hypothetical protein
VFIAGIILLNILSRSFSVNWSFLPPDRAWVGNFGLLLLAAAMLALALRLWSFGSLARILREDR